MDNFKARLICLPVFVTLSVLLLLPIYTFAAEKIGTVIALKGSVKQFNAQSKFLMDLKVNDDIYPGDIIVTGAKVGAQIAISYHTSVSVSPNAIISFNRKVSKKKKESYSITVLRGRIRTTSYKKLLVKKGESKTVHKLNINTPYGIFSFNGGDLVVDVSDVSTGVKSENTIPIPCPSQVMVPEIGKLADALINGELPGEASVTMEQCPEASQGDDVKFAGFQNPKIKTKMMSRGDTAFINSWIISGEVGYTPPLKKRPVLTLKSGEKMAFDGVGKVVLKD